MCEAMLVHKIQVYCVNLFIRTLHKSRFVGYVCLKVKPTFYHMCAKINLLFNEKYVLEKLRLCRRNFFATKTAISGKLRAKTAILALNDFDRWDIRSVLHNSAPVFLLGFWFNFPTKPTPINQKFWRRVM